jgi:LemA protein
MMRHSRWSLTLLAGLTLSASGCGYNRLQGLDEAVNQAGSQIKVQMQRRFDLIPNLVNTVKGITQQEQTVFGELAEARSKLGGAIQSGDVPAMGAANAAMTAPLGRLLAVAEAYPELKSSENFKQLQDELAGTENRIAVARTDYNKAVEDFNATIRKFPTNITAKLFGLGKAREYFEMTTPAAAAPPTVDFNH